MIALEKLFDNSPVARNFDKLGQLALDTGGRSLGLRVGTATATFTAGSVTPTVTVNHGLGRTPAFIAMQPRGGGSVQCSVDSRGDTTFTFRAYSTAGTSVTGTHTHDWLVIG